MTDRQLADLLDTAARSLPPLRALPDGAAARVHRRRRRRQALAGASSALAVAALVAGGLVLLPGHSDTVTAADTPPADPGVQLCLPHPVPRPTSLAVRCTPGSPVLESLTWQTYTPSTATGTGAYVDAGTSTPVSVRLSGQATQDGQPVYTFLELEFTGAPPAGSPAEEPLLGVRPDDDTGGTTSGPLPGVRGQDPTHVSVRPTTVCVACFADEPGSDVVVREIVWQQYTSTHAVGLGTEPQCAGTADVTCRGGSRQVTLVLTAPVLHDGRLQFATAGVRSDSCGRAASCPGAAGGASSSFDVRTALVLGPSTP